MSASVGRNTRDAAEEGAERRTKESCAGAKDPERFFVVAQSQAMAWRLSRFVV